MKEEKELWETKLGVAKTKVGEFVALEKALKSSLEDVIRSKKDLEDELLELKGEMLATFDTCFECVNEHVSLF